MSMSFYLASDDNDIDERNNRGTIVMDTENTKITSHELYISPKTVEFPKETNFIDRMKVIETQKRKGKEYFKLSLFSIGYISNSFFAPRLFFVTFMIVIMDIAALTLYFGNFLPIQIDGIHLKEKTTTQEYNSCNFMSSFAILIYRLVIFHILIGLPSLGFSIFDLFIRKGVVEGDSTNAFLVKKIRRTYFLQTLEIIISCLFVFLILMFLYLCSLFFGNQDTAIRSPFSCKELPVYLFSFFSFIVYCLTFVQIICFTRMREHIKMLLGAFKESDQTGHIRSLYKQKLQKDKIFNTRDTISRRKTISILRKKIYKAVGIDDISEVERLIKYAQESIGPDFVGHMYKPAKLTYNLYCKSKKNPMHLAAYRGNIKIMELLVKAGVKINLFDKFSRVRFSTGDIFWYFMKFIVSKPAGILRRNGGSSIFKSTLVTPLHCATATSRLAAVRWLIKNGADVNVFSKSSNRSERLPPLFLAEHPSIAECLLEAGANPLVIPDPGHRNTITALSLAYSKENYAVANVIEEHGGDIALTPLHLAAANNNITKLTSFLKKKIDPDALGEQGYIGLHRRTPLHWASVIGSVDAVKILLSFKADPNSQDSRGRTPLHWAVKLNKLNVVSELLQAGSNASLVDKDQLTPITCASMTENINKNIILLLMKYGADINYSLPSTGDTALHIAMKLENRSTALTILQCGGDIMRVNTKGLRPLDCTTSTQFQFAIKKAAGNRDVMISYSHSHTEFATKLRQSLDKNNITTWLDLMDPSGIGGGAVWREEIARGISNAVVVLCILTENYIKSQWCLKELAYAKENGIPVIAVSCENVKIDEDLQVYLYTRQIIPFEASIKQCDKTNPRDIRYDYDDDIYQRQLRFLLDGIRDEIEKKRLIKIEKESKASGTFLLQESFSTDRLLHIDEVKDSFVFISHGNCHSSFLQRIVHELEERNIKCYLHRRFSDNTNKSAVTDVETEEKIYKAKEAILACSCFIVILSEKSANNETVNDQLAFAEDKKKKIIPILLTDPKLQLGQRYTLSKNEIYHFTVNIGFDSSFRRLFNAIREQYHDDENIRPTIDIESNNSGSSIAMLAGSGVRGQTIDNYSRKSSLIYSMNDDEPSNKHSEVFSTFPSIDL